MSEPINLYVGRQPILDRNQKLVAFELLFRSGVGPTAGVIDDTHATATVIANCFSGIGSSRVLDGHRAFINFSADLLLSDVIEVLPADRVVIELLETVRVDDAIVKRIADLKQRGYRFALDDVATPTQEMEALRGWVEVVKLDLRQIAPAAIVSLVRHFKPWNISLLAEKVESQDQARECRRLGIDLFQGYYFARPEVLSSREANPSSVALLRLLAIVMSDGTDREIEDELKRHPQLSVALMRIVNSVAFGTGRTLTSLRQCVTLLGRKHLQRWVQVLLYSARSTDGKAQNNPLLHAAATRARVMELLAQASVGNGHSDRAFLVGILSLVDVLLGMPMEDAIKELPIEAEVKAALLTRSGWEGRLLQAVEAREAEQLPMLQEALFELDPLDLNQMIRADWEAVAWADQVANA